MRGTTFILSSYQFGRMISGLYAERFESRRERRTGHGGTQAIAEIGLEEAHARRWKIPEAACGKAARAVLREPSGNPGLLSEVACGPTS
jgi:hypothetical protein